MVFSWLKWLWQDTSPIGRRQLLDEPFPAEWLSYLHKNVGHYHRLSEGEQAKLRDDLRVFIAEKNWEGCGGLQITDEIKVTIAAQACLLVLGMEHECYDRVKSILVYPRGYRAPSGSEGATGVIYEGGQERAGEAWYRGPVVLSWADVLAEGQNPGSGHNLVFHEFAHQLDMLNGVIDGTPPLRDSEQHRRWQEVMTQEYERLIEESERGRATLLDQYGTKDEGEFFAVATECFFDRPIDMRRRHPRLYEILREYYRQDPARRWEDAGGEKLAQKQ